MIFDAFVFRNEFECLAVRLHELSPYVDEFVLVEADFTFQGNPRELRYDGRFDEFPITYVKVKGDGGIADPWHREAHVRNSVLLGLIDADPDDVVLLSDVDEIPRHEAVLRAAERVHNGAAQVALEQSLCFYRPDNVASTPWHGTQVSTVEWLRQVGPDEVRRHRDTAEVEPNGGVHLCNFGDPEWIIEKLESFSHTEVNLPEYKDPDFLQRCIDEGREMTGRSDLVFSRRDVWQPEYLLANPDLFSKVPA